MQRGAKVKIFLTGSPATGKSTLCRMLAERDERVRIFPFGECMQEHLASVGKSVTLSEMRQGTLPIVSSDDIDAVCSQLLDWLSHHEVGSVSIIDSHQVTIESHGVSLRPFDENVLGQMEIDQVWVTVAEPQTAISRMSSDGKGRKIPSDFLAAVQDGAQMALAVRYSAIWGCPVHIIQNSGTEAALVEAALGLIG